MAGANPVLIPIVPVTVKLSNSLERHVSLKAEGK
jgi:hypothetical protein